MAKKEKVIFEILSPNEVKFKYKGHTFLLQENKRGVYSIGKAVQLYELEGLKKTHIKEIGWTKTDNHGGFDKDSLLQRYVSFEECKEPAIKYIDSLLS